MMNYGFKKFFAFKRHAKLQTCHSELAICHPELGSGSENTRFRNIFKMTKLHKLAAFTLAEVLITLAIIGIVAAMTIPTLIVNYQKREFASRLSQTFSVLSNAVKMAQVEYGDVATWGYQKNYGTTIAPGDDSSQYVKEFAEKYFIPYLKVSKNYGKIKLKDAGYSGYKTKDGRTYYTSNTKCYIVELQNYVTLIFSYHNGQMETDEILTSYLINPMIFIDVNGKAGPNILGRDFFLVELSASNNRLETYGQGYKRDYILELCSDTEGSLGNELYCTTLLQLDGWKFADDHPW